jgi:hypothetical protein
VPSVELLLALRRALLAEQERRARQRGWPLGADVRTVLYQKLDDMAARRRAVSGEPVPLTVAQRVDLVSYLNELGRRQAVQNR